MTDEYDIEAVLQHMLHRLPVSDLRTLYALDPVEMIEGYEAGRANFPCGDNRSRSFWHGWRNGMMDAGHTEQDWASVTVAKLYAAAHHRHAG